MVQWGILVETLSKLMSRGKPTGWLREISLTTGGVTDMLGKILPWYFVIPPFCMSGISWSPLSPGGGVTKVKSQFFGRSPTLYDPPIKLILWPPHTRFLEFFDPPIKGWWNFVIPPLTCRSPPPVVNDMSLTCYSIDFPNRSRSP